jgi:hypothetical protein
VRGTPDFSNLANKSVMELISFLRYGGYYAEVLNTLLSCSSTGSVV